MKILKELRTQYDLTQDALAFELGVNQQKISDLETGKIEPDALFLQKLENFIFKNKTAELESIIERIDTLLENHKHYKDVLEIYQLLVKASVLLDYGFNISEKIFLRKQIFFIAENFKPEKLNNLLLFLKEFMNFDKFNRFYANPFGIFGENDGFDNSGNKIGSAEGKVNLVELKTNQKMYLEEKSKNYGYNLTSIPETFFETINEICSLLGSFDDPRKDLVHLEAFIGELIIVLKELES